MKNRLGIGMLIAALATTWVVTTGVAYADEQAAAPAMKAAKTDAEGYRTATRLGGSRRFYRPLKDLAAVKRMAGKREDAEGPQRRDGQGRADAPHERDAEHSAGRRSGGDEGHHFPVGGTIDWMALRTRGKPDIITKVRWGGKNPFPAWEFFIDDGTRATRSWCRRRARTCRSRPSARARRPRLAAEAARKAEEARKAAEAAAEAARKAEEARRAEEARKAEEARQAELRRPPSCGLTATATYAKGIWTWTNRRAASAADPRAKSNDGDLHGPTASPCR